MKSVKRRKTVHNFNSARTAGVLFTADESTDFSLINSFLNDLINKEMKVFALAYIPSKHVPNDLSANRKINFFTKKELSFSFTPKSQLAESFINKEIDLLIDLTSEKYFPAIYINNLSKAAFKVGSADAEKKDFDLMFSLKENHDMHYFIEQIKHYLSQIKNEKNIV
jgi:hypothetical protein